MHFIEEKTAKNFEKNDFYPPHSMTVWSHFLKNSVFKEKLSFEFSFEVKTLKTEVSFDKNVKKAQQSPLPPGDTETLLSSGG